MTLDLTDDEAMLLSVLMKVALWACAGQRAERAIHWANTAPVALRASLGLKLTLDGEGPVAESLQRRAMGVPAGSG